MIYGYDQVVMSQVNLNEDYWNHMGINAIKGNQMKVATGGGIVSVYYGGTLVGALITGSFLNVRAKGGGWSVVGWSIGK